MGAEPTTPIGRRHDSRLRVEVPAKLILLTGKINTSLRDLSQTGARLVVPKEVHSGMDGVLSWLQYETFGRIVWARGGFAGMEFDESLNPDILLKTREVFDYRDFKTEDDLAQEKAREWFHGYKRNTV